MRVCIVENDQSPKVKMNVVMLEQSLRKQLTLSTIRLWHMLVYEYSEKQLTYERDIFPALQGVACEFLSRRQCAYYAGVWEDNLVGDLLWKSQSEGSRPHTWRTPSWSWASTLTSVLWLTSVVSEAYVFVREMSTVPVGLDPIGELRDASLKLQGICVDACIIGKKEALIHQHCPDFVHSDHDLTLRRRNGEHIHSRDFWPDIHLYSTSVLIMLVVKTTMYDPNLYQYFYGRTLGQAIALAIRT